MNEKRMRLFEFRSGRCDRLAEWLTDRRPAGGGEMESDRKTRGETLCVLDVDWTVSKQEIPCSGNHIPGGTCMRLCVSICVHMCLCLSSPAIFLPLLLHLHLLLFQLLHPHLLLFQLLRHPCVCTEGSLTASLVD